MSRLRSFVVQVAAITMLSLCALTVAAQSEPCDAQIRDALLAANLEQISQAAGPLRLLNGKEDPKLKRLLEFQLATAAADARRYITQGARFGPVRLTNLARGVERAIAYVAKHPVDKKMLETLGRSDRKVYPPSGRNLENPGENLALVEKWLREHQARIKQ